MFELRHTKTRTGSGLARLQHARAHEHFTPRSYALSTPGEPAGQPTKDWAAPLLMPIRVRGDFKPQSHARGLTRFPGRSFAELRVTNERLCSAWKSPRICWRVSAFDVLLLLQLSDCKGGTESTRSNSNGIPESDVPESGLPVFVAINRYY